MMKYSYFILIYSLAAIDSIIFFVSMRYRDKKAVKSFAVLVMLIIISHIFYGASLVISAPKIKYFVHEMKFFGVVYFSVAFFVMYMRLFDRHDMLRKRNIILLSVVPTISVILAATNDYHHLFRLNLYIVDNAYGSFIGVQSGPLFWPYTIYTYSVFAFVVYIIIRAYLKTPRIYRMQLGIIVMAAVATMLINFISISGLLFEDFGDATLISFSFAAMIQFYGLILYKPARMIKMARGLAVNEIKDPIIAFDYRGIFLGANSAAHGMFALEPGISREEFLSQMLGLPDMDSDLVRKTLERGNLWFNVKMRKIYDGDGALAVSVILLSDITGIKQRERELENTANFDYLTGIANRHSYLSELDRLADKDLPVSVIHLSISGMKAINSLRGNEEGDAVIKRVASVLAQTGDRSFCARIGGDEFALILRKTAREQALAVIDEVKSRIPEVRLISGLAVKQSNLDNINIINKLSMDDMLMNKLISHSGTMGRRE